MAGEKPTSQSKRGQVLRFAAHLAHLLNRRDAGVVEVQPFALYKEVMTTLEAREPGRNEGRYDALVGKHLLGPGISSEQAAETYFDQVLRRSLQLARDGHVHKGHELFLA